MPKSELHQNGLVTVEFIEMYKLCATADRWILRKNKSKSVAVKELQLANL